MGVYIDTMKAKYGRMVMCHMTADTLEELHAMADKIGVKRRWFQCPPKASRPHYVICQSKKAKALAAGAIEVPQYVSGYFAAKLAIEYAEMKIKDPHTLARAMKAYNRSLARFTPHYEEWINAQG